jgi:alpha/beta superfamily hydrolase
MMKQPLKTALLHFYKDAFSWHAIFFATVIITAMFSTFFVSAHQASEKPFFNETPKKVSDNFVQFKAQDEFLLAGLYYPGKAKSAGVIILHDCANDSRNYQLLAKKLSDQGLNTLLMDLRGYGESATSEVSQQKIKAQAKSIVEYQSGLALITSYWEGDLLTAHAFLRSKVDKKKEIAIVSSGCSAIYAVSLAEKIHLNSMVMITPQMSFSDKERYKNLVDIPTYFINSSHHHETFQTTKELFEWNGSNLSKIQIFKGNHYDYALLKRKNYLVDDIALWLKANLM